MEHYKKCLPNVCYCTCGASNHCCSCKHKSKPCKDNLSEFLGSAADIEKALANAINAKSELLRDDNLTPKEKILYSTKLENLIKLAIKKEIILEFLLEDAINVCEFDDKCKKHWPKGDSHSGC
ncbi:hypothetical protein [Virgibacillus sp. SK37]|uniref:hypothetical protein n=1 Tax=Virgibacillus sp. SK37 TaxID=403957 RepID=UPI0004D11BD9|nr:hypothetical protein [Virgibacillus sp. SK37]AIF45487.1 hypothetical protein X953_13870 [Virgibacillus sp. SK37]